MSIINSINNFRVLQWCKLKEKVYRDKHKLFIAEGYHLVAEAYKTNYLNEIITTESKKSFDVPTYQVTDDVMKKLSSLATPTKILGICNQKEQGKYKSNVLIIDQIHHPGNLGTIIRNAVAFNVDTIALNNCADIYNQKVIQSSQGMVFYMNFIKCPLPDFMAKLQNEGYQIIGTDVKEGISLKEVDRNEKRAILLGNESDGVDDELLGMCDLKVRIEMNGKCESLNVGVAAGIILYYLL